jgi:hypothetical protein
MEHSTCAASAMSKIHTSLPYLITDAITIQAPHIGTGFYQRVYTVGLALPISLAPGPLLSLRPDSAPTSCSTSACFLVSSLTLLALNILKLTGP